MTLNDWVAEIETSSSDPERPSAKAKGNTLTDPKRLTVIVQDSANPETLSDPQRPSKTIWKLGLSRNENL